MLLESYHMMMDEVMSQDQARNLKLEIYRNLQKNLPFTLFQVFDGRYKQKHTLDWI